MHYLRILTEFLCSSRILRDVMSIMVPSVPLHDININLPAIPRPQTPSTHTTSSSTFLTAPQTPRKWNTNRNEHLRGIKTTLPDNLSLASISRCLVDILLLSYTPDAWQVHVIRRILQGYDSILCAGTDYGKSLIFEGLAVLGALGKLVIIISPLKALEHDQVSCYKIPMQ